MCIRDRFYVGENLGTYFLCFNVNSPMFEGMTSEQASSVRRAISMLIDRSWISETVRLTEPPANTFVPAAMSDGNGGAFRQNDDAYTLSLIHISRLSGRHGGDHRAGGADCAIGAFERPSVPGHRPAH